MRKVLVVLIVLFSIYIVAFGLFVVIAWGMSLGDDFLQVKSQAQFAMVEVGSLSRELARVRETVAKGKFAMVEVGSLSQELAQVRETVAKGKEEAIAEATNATREVKLSQRLVFDHTESNHARFNRVEEGMRWDSFLRLREIFAKFKTASFLQQEGWPEEARTLALVGMSELAGMNVRSCARHPEFSVRVDDVPEEIRWFFQNGSPYVIIGELKEEGYLKFRVEALWSVGC